MLGLKSKYGTAKVFANIIDDESISQVMDLLSMPYVKNQTIRMMPDIHAGAGCTIGTTMTISDKICPNLVGVDIGCGMYAVHLKETEIDFAELDDTIHKFVPSGRDIHDKALWVGLGFEDNLKSLRCAKFINIERALRSIGTLGSGNHFVEVDKASDGTLWLVIHSGSRHLGLEVAKYYQNIAIKECHKPDKELIDKTIADLKAQGRQKEIQQVLATLQPKAHHIPDSLCYLEGQSFDDYIHDMHITQLFAYMNRIAIGDQIMRHMDLHLTENFTTIHNYIDTRHMILRKGAVSAQDGETLIIPINMREGSLICKGKGNPDWNYSAPHGAGRLYSRSQARKFITMDEFRWSMKDIWTTSVDESTLDESPMAYKPIDSILKNIVDTVDVVDTIKPVYNFKAGQ